MTVLSIMIDPFILVMTFILFLVFWGHPCTCTNLVLVNILDGQEVAAKKLQQFGIDPLQVILLSSSLPHYQQAAVDDHDVLGSENVDADDNNVLLATMMGQDVMTAKRKVPSSIYMVVVEDGTTTRLALSYMAHFVLIYGLDSLYLAVVF
jgi:hypothetical protein